MGKCFLLLLGFKIASPDARQTTLAPMERATAHRTRIVRETDTTPAVSLALVSILLFLVFKQF